VVVSAAMVDAGPKKQQNTVNATIVFFIMRPVGPLTSSIGF
jgi:hypothetical protein